MDYEEASEAVWQERERALREENARLKLLPSEGAWRETARMLRELTRERDEARAALAAEREHHHHAHGPNCREAEAEVARLEGLILDWRNATREGERIAAYQNLMVESARIRAQREEGRCLCDDESPNHCAKCTRELLAQREEGR